MRIFENFRKTPAYKACWKITLLFALIAIYLKIESRGAGLGAIGIAFFFAITVITYIITFITLSIIGIFQRNSVNKTKPKNKFIPHTCCILIIAIIAYCLYAYCTPINHVAKANVDPLALCVALLATCITVAIFTILTITDILRKKQNKKLEYKTSIVADIGYIISLLLCCLIFDVIYENFLSDKHKNHITVYNLDYTLQEMQYRHDDCKSQQDLINCLAKSFKRNPSEKINIKDNVISRKDLTYKVVINENCNKNNASELTENNCYIEIKLKDVAYKDKHIKAVLQYNYDGHYNGYYNVTYYQVCENRKEKCGEKRTIRH